MKSANFGKIIVATAFEKARLLGIVVSLCFAIGVAKAGILFRDDFSAPSGPWNQFDGTFSIAGGTYSITGATDGRAVAFVGQTSLYDYTFEVDANLIATNVNEGFDVLFHVQSIGPGTDNGHYYQFTARPNGHATLFEIDSPGSGTKILASGINPTYSLNSWHHIRVDIRGQQATAYLDGVPYLSYNSLSDFTYGGIGLKAFGGDTILYDNVLLTGPTLDYFGVGVNWSKVSDSSMTNVLGNLDASNLQNHLQTDLPSAFKKGVIVPLDATATSTDNLNIINGEFENFTNSIWTNDTVVFYVSSHGGILSYQYGLPHVDLQISSDDTGVLANSMVHWLGSLPSSTRKIAILDACHAGGVAAELSSSIRNISILAASSAASITLAGVTYGGITQSRPDGTGVFTDALIAELDSGVFDLNRIVNDINNNVLGTYASLMGKNLALRDSGSVVFTGLQSQIYEQSSFTGNLASNTVTFSQSLPKVSMAKVDGGSFHMTLTNVPSSGSIAVEVSTNLNSWLQVTFSPATGTNLDYSFSITNAPYQFFRTKVVP